MEKVPFFRDISKNKFTLILYFKYKFFGQHAIILGQDFVKNLTRIGRSLNTIIIVDNMPQNFSCKKKMELISVRFGAMIMMIIAFLI